MAASYRVVTVERVSTRDLSLRVVSITDPAILATFGEVL